MRARAHTHTHTHTQRLISNIYISFANNFKLETNQIQKVNGYINCGLIIYKDREEQQQKNGILMHPIT